MQMMEWKTLRAVSIKLKPKVVQKLPRLEEAKTTQETATLVIKALKNQQMRKNKFTRIIIAQPIISLRIFKWKCKNKLWSQFTKMQN